MNLIRTTLLDSSEDGLTKGIGSDGAYRRVSLTGRYNETMQSYIYQHYGFASAPKVGMELIVIKDGNVYLTVAENDGSNRPAVASGDTMMYTDSTHYILIEDGGDITIVNGDATISLQSDKTITLNNGNGSMVIDGSTGQVDINNGNLTVDK